MRHSPKSLLLEDEIGLLVRHFGLEQVRAVVAKFSIRGSEEPHALPRNTVRSDRKPGRPTIVNALELVRGSDPEKYRLLSEFLTRLRDREILPESQDIRHFAQLVGLKDIQGKSRKDMIPTLMRFLLQRSTESLRVGILRADNISQQQRQEGFSVLTDKLLGKR
jgi:hypothetical protein